MPQEEKEVENGESQPRLTLIDQVESVKRIFDVLNMWPKGTSGELEQRGRVFIMNAEAEELLRMQRTAFDTVGQYVFDDVRVQPLIVAFEGRQIGFAIRKFYQSTVREESSRFVVESGIEPGIPVMWCANRADYADAMFGTRDPLKMIITRKMGATHLPTLLRWWLPHLEVLASEDIMQAYASIAPQFEKAMDAELAAMGY
jgi:hypothetical protein